MLESLSLKNFKSFASAKIPLAPFTLVIGANGAGKSNFFDALRLLRAIGEGRSVRDALEGHALPGATTATAVAGVRGGASAITHFLSGSQRFSMSAIIRNGRARIQYDVEIDASKYRVVNEELRSTSHAGSYVFSTKPDTGPLDQLEESPVITARFHKMSRGLNPRRDFSPHEFILSQFTGRRAESRANEEVADLVREEFAAITPLELRPEVLRQYSPRGRADLGEHGENFASVVANLWDRANAPQFRFVSDSGRSQLEEFVDADARDSMAALKSWLGEITPRTITEVLTQHTPTGEVIFAVREEPYDDPIAAPSLSDGTLRFAALALVATATPGRRALVVEEIENGINPSRVATLVQMLEQATADSQVQVIASSHSPAVLDYAGERAVQSAVVIGWDEENQSSRPVLIKNLPSIEEVRKRESLGDLQVEGWLQLAAGM
ncbi:AAA family ATPase [Cellulosimicrobium funkei]